MEEHENLLNIYDSINTEEKKAILGMHNKHKKLLELAVNLLKLSRETFPHKKNIPQDKVSKVVERCLLALYAQAFRIYRAVIILLKSGLDSESIILLRSLLENVSYLLYISEKDYDERLELYKHSTSLSLVSAVNVFVEGDREAKAKLNMDWYEKSKQEALKYFQDKYDADMNKSEDKRKYALRPDKAAEQLEGSFQVSMMKYYKTFYRHASGIAHAARLLDFITPEGDKFILEIAPRGKNMNVYLQMAIRLFAHTVARLNGLLNLGKDSEIDIIMQEIAKLDS